MNRFLQFPKSMHEILLLQVCYAEFSDEFLEMCESMEENWEKRETESK